MKKIVYKKTIGFTESEQEAFNILKSYGVNVSQFIRAAIKEKLQREWKSIKETKEKIKLPF